MEKWSKRGSLPQSTDLVSSEHRHELWGIWNFYGKRSRRREEAEFPWRFRATVGFGTLLPFRKQPGDRQSDEFCVNVEEPFLDLATLSPITCDEENYVERREFHFDANYCLFAASDLCAGCLEVGNKRMADLFFAFCLFHLGLSYSTQSWIRWCDLAQSQE